MIKLDAGIGIKAHSPKTMDGLLSGEFPRAYIEFLTNFSLEGFLKEYMFVTSVIIHRALTQVTFLQELKSKICGMRERRVGTTVATRLTIIIYEVDNGGLKAGYGVMDFSSTVDNRFQAVGERFDSFQASVART